MDAYSASQLLEQLSERVVNAGHLTNKQKCVISEKLAVCSHRLLEGGAEVMQLTDLGCTVIMANNNPWDSTRTQDMVILKKTYSS